MNETFMGNTLSVNLSAVQSFDNVLYIRMHVPPMFLRLGKSHFRHKTAAYSSQNQTQSQGSDGDYGFTSVKKKAPVELAPNTLISVTKENNDAAKAPKHAIQLCLSGL